MFRKARLVLGILCVIAAPITYFALAFASSSGGSWSLGGCATDRSGGGVIYPAELVGILVGAVGLALLISCLFGRKPRVRAEDTHLV